MRRDGEMKPLIWGESKAECFRCDDWTDEIRLKLLGKFWFWCSGMWEDLHATGTASRHPGPTLAGKEFPFRQSGS
jgi:hypothetical protein